MISKSCRMTCTFHMLCPFSQNVFSMDNQKHKIYEISLQAISKKQGRGVKRRALYSGKQWQERSITLKVRLIEQLNMSSQQYPVTEEKTKTNKKTIVFVQPWKKWLKWLKTADEVQLFNLLKECWKSLKLTDNWKVRLRSKEAGSATD